MIDALTVKRASAPRSTGVSVSSQLPVGAGGPDPSLSPFLNSLRRQWLLGGLLGTLLAIPAAWSVWSMQTAKYSSSAFLRVSSQDVQLMFQTADQAGREDFRIFKNTQRQLVTSPFVLSKAVNRPEVAALPAISEMPDPIQWLEAELKVLFLEDSEIMKVELAHADPKVAQTVVTAVIEAFLSGVVDAERDDRSKRLASLEVAFHDAEAKTRTKRAALREMADTLGTSDKESLSLAQQGTMQQFGLLRSELMKVQFELMKAVGEQELLLNARRESAVAAGQGEASNQLVSTQDGADAEVDAAVETDAKHLKLANEREHLAGLMKQAEKRLNPDVAAARIASYRKDMSTIDQQLETRRAQLRNRLDAKTTEARDPLLAAKVRVSVLQKQEAQLQEDVKRHEEEAKKYGRSSIDVEMMRTEIDSLDAIVQEVAGEIERTKIELRSASRITKISDGTAGTLANARKRAATSAGAGMLAFGFPLLLLLARDVRRQHVDTSQGVTDALGLNVLGTLPTIPSRFMRRLGDGSKDSERWRWRMMESINSIAAILLRNAAMEGRKMYLISSAESGEGKSTLSRFLSISLAESGHKTLVIDFDLRRPTLHYAFCVSQTPGVSDVLTQKITLHEACVPTTVANLSLLPAGHWQGNLLADSRTGALKELLAEARDQFDFVVVDGCPVLAAVDSRLIGQNTDGVIVTIRKDISQMPKVTAACEAFRTHGVPIVGSVVSGSDEETYYDSSYSDARVSQPAITST